MKKNMQVTPRFETYKIIEQHTILKDDTGNEICLTLLEVMLPSDDYEVIVSSYKFWTVIGKHKIQWNNKAVSYNSDAFWKAKTKDKLFKGVINGFMVEEKEAGEHFIFDNNNLGLRTNFKIKKI